jgi:hypothetical protein
MVGKAWSSFGKELEIINQEACIFINSMLLFRLADLFLVLKRGSGSLLLLGRVIKLLYWRIMGISILLLLMRFLTVGETADEARIVMLLWSGHVRLNS